MASTAKHDWPLVRLGDVCEVVSGGTPKTSVEEYWDGDIPWVTPADLSKLKGLEVSAGERLITQRGVDKSSAVLLPAGSVVLSSRAPIGYVAIAQVPMATNQGCKSFIPSPDIDARYLAHYLLSQKDVLQSLGTGATFKELSKSRAADIRIPLPPLDEQRRIAAILDEVEKVRFSQAAKLRCLYELVDARGSKTAEEANVTKRLDELCDVQGGISLGGARKKYPESAPYLRVANVFRNAIDLSEVKTVPIREGELEKYSLLSGDILVVEAHGNRREVGRGAMLTESLEGHVYQNHLFRVRPHKGVDSETLVQLWNSPSVRKQILSIVSTTSGLNTTSISKIRSIQVPIPTSEVQAEFSELLHALTGLITQEKQQLNKVLELTSSLSARAFQGEL